MQSLSVFEVCLECIHLNRYHKTRPQNTKMAARRTRAQQRVQQQAQAWPDLGTNANLMAAPHPMGGAAQKEWLQRSANWPDMNPYTTHRRWRPRRILGSGASGLVGLWEFLGREPPVARDDTPTKIAVKQSAGLEARLKLQWESKLLQQINGAHSRHVVKIYKGFHLDGGTGTEATRDPIPFDADGNYNEDLLVARKLGRSDTLFTTSLRYTTGYLMIHNPLRKLEGLLTVYRHISRIL